MDLENTYNKQQHIPHPLPWADKEETPQNFDETWDGATNDLDDLRKYLQQMTKQGITCFLK
jgi:hypothetical protein